MLCNRILALSLLSIACAGCGRSHVMMSAEPHAAADDTSFAVAGAALRQRNDKPRLVGWAALDHSERYPGPTTGQFGGGGPYDDQPIPGWSGLLKNAEREFLAMPDNGYGSKANSADYVLGYYIIKPEFKRQGDGTTNPGAITNQTFVAFNDRDSLLNNGAGVDLLIIADLDSYRSGSGFGTNSGIPVDPDIRSRRLLTGYDFDIESIARATDGTLWVGEEFGPFILHFDVDGTLLDEPVPHPILKSPQHPAVIAAPGTHTLASSRGFESLSFDAQQKYLYAVTESAPLVDALRPVPGDERVVSIDQFDPESANYTGVSFKYRKEGTETDNQIVIGDMTSVGNDKFVLIERDNFGLDAAIKHLYVIDLAVVDSDGILKKNLLIDLLNISDPRDIGGPLANLADDVFNLPFVSVECVLQTEQRELAVAIDTNFPATGRDPSTPASTEIVTIRFPRSIASYAPCH